MENNQLDIERMKKGKIYYYFLFDVLKSIDDIKYAIVKGETLSLLEYGKCGCRDYADIDILIERKNINDLISSLEKKGFKPIDSTRYKQVFYDLYSHQTIPYYKKIGILKILVDINYDIFWGEYDGNKIDIGEFLSDCVYQQIFGKKVKILSPLKAFVQLVLHTYKDMNSLFLLNKNAGYRKKGFQDVYLILKNHREELSAKRINNICMKYKILPYAYYVLYYTFCLYKDNWLLEYLQVMECEEGLKLLPCFGLNHSERREWECNFLDRFNIKNFKDLVKDKYPDKDIKKIFINEMVSDYEK